MRSLDMCAGCVLPSAGAQFLFTFTLMSLESTDGEGQTNHENSFHEGAQNRRLTSGMNDEAVLSLANISSDTVL